MHVLLIEDSRRLQDSLSAGLERCGYGVDIAGDGEAGLRYARHNQYDVIILDLMLPKIDGLTALRELRENGDETHVLILTARDAVEDRVNGLRDGADDYLVKPFAFDELLARVEALVRRKYQAKNPVIRVGPLTIDTTARVVTVAGRDAQLSRREYALIEYLAYRKGQIVDRRQIEDHLYGERNFPMSNAVDRLVCTLRKKIGSGERPVLATRRGLGYVLEEPAS
ncbi:MAG: response regulator transcription factor [Phycisphaerales bacterium]|nr:response regulator transcription factor [Phycisphaerae bacterium]NNF43035.1 response regulator transcription factor [Phycisphaerales bacterium]NNM25614.1 response regulator transcription factor [Phycisphaerales bacterium]